MSGYWPEGVPTSINYPELTLLELHASAAARYAHRVAVIDGDERLTYAQLHERAAAFANALRAHRIGEGDVVLLHLSNNIWFPVSYYCALLAGAAVSLANPLEPAAALHRQLLDTGAAAAVSHPAHAAALRAARTGTSLRTLVVVPPTACAPADGAHVVRDPELCAAELVEGHSATRPEVSVGPDDLAHLAYTGGTTGVPKGVRVLHRNLVANTAQMTAWRAAHVISTTAAGTSELRPIEGAPQTGVRPGEAVSAVVSPLYHAHALVNMNFLLTCGTTLVLSGRFAPQQLLSTIEEHRVTYLTGSPTMWHQLLNCPDLARHDLSSARVLSSGAAPIDRTTLEALQAAFPAAVIAEGYGQTEATCMITASPIMRDARSKTGSVGLPVMDTHVEVRCPTDDRTPRPANEVGELWVRGPQVTAGYLNQPEATADQFVDGWLRTGDLGYRDEDGFVFLVGRSKDMLIYKGYNVYPRELEEVLCAHPDVDSVAVVGRDDSTVGEEPFAFVVPRPGTAIDVDGVKEFVAERVLPYKKIRHVELVDALPTTAAGKVTKAELRDRANAKSPRQHGP